MSNITHKILLIVTSYVLFAKPGFLVKINMDIKTMKFDFL